jgi:hypothetical protein
VRKALDARGHVRAHLGEVDLAVGALLRIPHAQTRHDEVIVGFGPSRGHAHDYHAGGEVAFPREVVKDEGRRRAAGPLAELIVHRRLDQRRGEEAVAVLHELVAELPPRRRRIDQRELALQEADQAGIGVGFSFSVLR